MAGRSCLPSGCAPRPRLHRRSSSRSAGEGRNRCCARCSCVAVDLVWRHGMFREGAARAAEYLATAERYGSHRDRAAAHLILARARAALGEFAAADEAISRGARAHAADRRCRGVGRPAAASPRQPSPTTATRTGRSFAERSQERAANAAAGLLFSALGTLADARAEPRSGGASARSPICSTRSPSSRL